MYLYLQILLSTLVLAAILLNVVSSDLVVIKIR
jgi:hypothetical protein